MENNPYGMAAMWAQGDWVIKSVALLLLIMSIASWYVIITRSIRLYRLRKNVATVDKFWHTHSFAPHGH
jgi:biopolymer transport protein ExbB